ncbi:hypothetical protein [Dendronalium sp. ChiSLP03b]|uniref:hypothetical protein n=1 Tax=Dendronalium sp. ChiSLP03b TaxID=3075381 RepID=UPI002AD20A88|nr:hypothetical protein [Dendronalium sp. ChiSLP03b]MDZ8209320.1 hypothetical protein [Dendronalium sp. ChiSLP03b]
MDSQSQLQSPPETFLAPLLELRDYYAPLVENYEKLYTQALANLNHVEALLSNWSSNSQLNGNLSTDEMMNEVVTASAFENLRITETQVKLGEPTDSEIEQTNDLEIDNSSRTSQNIDIPLVAGEVVTAAESENSLFVNSDSITEPQVDLVQPVGSEVGQTNDLEINESFSESTDTDTPEQAPDKLLKWSEIPMNSEYQSLNRTEAIQKVLQKHAGTMCHIDFIVRSLYGELKPDVFKVVKGRVHSTLTRGRESGKWFTIPGKPGCYTLDLKLLNSNRNSSSSKQSKNQNKKPDPVAKTNLIPMLGEFEGQFLIDALTSLLQQNPKKVFNVAEIIEELYGELDISDVREVKPKVLNELSRGHRTGRFSRVPEEKGLYTWDSKLLTKASAS